MPPLIRRSQAPGEDPKTGQENRTSGSLAWQPVSRETGSRNRSSAALDQPFRSCRAMTMRWIWLVPS